MMDVYQSIHDSSLTLCPSCNEPTLERVITGGLGCIVKDVKTIGQLADSNWKKLGSYEKSERLALDKKTTVDKPVIYGNATKSQINSMSENQKQKYIITGET